MSPLPSPPVLRSARRFVPRCEALEERSLLSVTVTPFLDGSVLVRGSNRNDHIVVEDDGSNRINNVIIIVDKQMFVPGIAVNTVRIRTRAGDDTVNYSLNGDLQAGVVRTIRANLGNGADQFQTRLKHNLLARSNLSLIVNGTTGRDVIGVTAMNPTNIATGATLNLSLSGSSGPDNISVNYDGQLAGTLSLFALGKDGADEIDAAFLLEPGSSGTLAAQQIGGFGNDRFFFSARKVSLLDSGGIIAQIDGGPGRNRCSTTANVTRTHCTRVVSL